MVSKGKFLEDLVFAENHRSRLKIFYKDLSHEGRYVFINKVSHEMGKMLQNNSVDTIIQYDEYTEYYIEEKIVRYPGYEYQNYTLEIMSCTIPGKLNDGWMKKGKADVLLYGFLDANDGILVHTIPFQKLKLWFWDVYENYKSTITNQINKTECKIVPILDVQHNVGLRRYYISPDNRLSLI